MKKFLIALCALTIVSGVANAQNGYLVDDYRISVEVTELEILQTIDSARSFNKEINGIIHPDSIFPGQTFTVFLGDSAQLDEPVDTGSTQWQLTRRLLWNYKYRLAEAALDERVRLEDSLKNLQTLISDTLGKNFPNNEHGVDSIGESKWVWLAGLLLTLLLFYYLFGKGFPRLLGDGYKNPVTAGIPIVEGGITYGQENEHKEAVGAFRTNYGPRVNVTHLRRCLISTKGNERMPVRFGNGNVKNLILRNERGYEGEIDGVKRYIIGGCGNGFDHQEHMTGEGLRIEYLDDVPVMSRHGENGIATLAGELSFLSDNLKEGDNLIVVAMNDRLIVTVERNGENLPRKKVHLDGKFPSSESEKRAH